MRRPPPLRIVNPTIHHRKRKSRRKTITDIFEAAAPAVIFLAKVIDEDAERYFKRSKYGDPAFKSVPMTLFLQEHYPKEVAQAEAELLASGWHPPGDRNVNWRRPDDLVPYFERPGKAPRKLYRLSAAILEERARRAPQGHWWAA